jgi:endonuclease YncB( thermonuclease family)
MGRAMAALLLSAWGLPAQAQPVTITDGNRITIDGAGYRLSGIDAPDARELCDDGYPAGQEAIKALLGLMKGRTITCDAGSRDPSGLTLAVCYANGRDLGEAMVRAGAAWADPRTGRAYAVVQHDAEADRLGVHDHSCLLPWKWRADPR